MYAFKKYLPTAWLQEQSVTYQDGTKLPMTVVGNTDGAHKPVLLLHAFGMDARQFIPFILPRLKDHCFYLPHLRGFGLAADSPTTQLDFIEQYADDVEVLLAHICAKHQLKAIPVAAISMGALVMWAYFHRYTSTNQLLGASDLKVSRYLNIDQSPVTYNQPDWQGGVFGTEQPLIFAQFQALLDDITPYISALDSPVPARFTDLPFALKRHIIQMESAFSLLAVSRPLSQLFIKASTYQPTHKLSIADHTTWQQKMRCLQAYLTKPYDYRQGIENLAIPITMLIGGRSKIYDPVWQRRVADMAPYGQAIEIPQSGHAIPMDAPLAFTHALSDFLLKED